MALISQRQAQSMVFYLISLVIPDASRTIRSCLGRRTGRKNLPTISCVDPGRPHNVYFAHRVGYVGLMLRPNPRVMSATKGTFGAGEVVRADVF